MSEQELKNTLLRKLENLKKCDKVYEPDADRTAEIVFLEMEIKEPFFTKELIDE